MIVLVHVDATMSMSEERIIKRIKRKMKLVKILNVFLPKKIVPRVAIFISNHFGWIFG